MRGVTPPFPNTSSWCDAQLSTGTTLPLPFINTYKFQVPKSKVLPKIHGPKKDEISEQFILLHNEELRHF